MPQPIETLGPLRHHCYACGKCCFGIQIPLPDPEERTRIARYGEILDIPEAVENNEIRVVEGRCSFLDDDLLCRIHKEFGFENKPHRCREFPLKATRTESNRLRAAIDPGCVNTYRSWREGEDQLVDNLVIHDSNWEQPDQKIEAMLLHVAQQPKATIGSILQLMSPAAPVLLVSLRAGGTGLNLTRATHVIHYDRWWNPAVEDQATDRAYRIGQNQKVQVYKMVCQGTLEERIDSILEEKRALAEAVIGGGEGWLTELDNDALRAVVNLGTDACVRR